MPTLIQDRKHKKQKADSRRFAQAVSSLLGEEQDTAIKRYMNLIGEGESPNLDAGYMVEPTQAQLTHFLILLRERRRDALELLKRLQGEGLSGYVLKELEYSISCVERLILETEMRLLVPPAKLDKQGNPIVRRG